MRPAPPPILTARDPSIPAAQQYRAASAVWAAIAAAADAGADGDPTRHAPGDAGDDRRRRRRRARSTASSPR